MATEALNRHVTTRSGEDRAVVRDRLFIAGQWRPSESDSTLDVVDATTEQVMGSVPAGTPGDLERAAQAARGAFEHWSETPPEERAALCACVADELESREEEIATLITREVGMPLALSRAIQARLPILSFASIPRLIEELAWENEIGNSLIVREPVGVVGAIAPWNYPLHQVCAKVAPALAAGCAVVVKPSEVAPLSAFVLAEILEAQGLPPGVFNIVTGVGTTVGEAIIASEHIDMISFTGSTRAGRRVGEVASQRIKRVALELGGKSANVILEDADLERAITDGVGKCFLNSGQTCSALTRMLVPRTRLAEVEQIALAAVERITVGDPFDDDVVLGPLVSAAQRKRVRDYIETGQREGAKLLTGGTEPPDGLTTGFFVRPTVFSEVSSAMTIAQEEIFGPVLSIIPYEDEAEAATIANDSIYGLSGGVWSADEDRALHMARRMRTGQVEINGGPFNPLAPFGGYKQSGRGRELGRVGLEEFLEVKSVQR